MKLFTLVVLLIALTSCATQPQPLIITVDNSTKLRLTPEEAIYETKVVFLGSNDTVTVFVSPDAWDQIKKSNHKRLTINKK